MKNTYSSIIVILVLVVAVLSFMLLKDKKEEQLSGVINQTNNREQINNMATEQKIEGLDIKVLKDGSGAEAKNGDMVAVHYTGKLVDGTVFDSSIPRGEPIEFKLGSGMVIQGWEKGILGMKVGEKRELTIGSALAYGDAGITAPNGQVVIPEKATLIFEVELVSVK